MDPEPSRLSDAGPAVPHAGLTAYSLGQVQQDRGDLARAEALYRKALLLFQQMRAAPKITRVEGLVNRVSRQREALSPPKKP
jgi:hypothetical protein